MSFVKLDQETGTDSTQACTNFFEITITYKSGRVRLSTGGEEKCRLDWPEAVSICNNLEKQVCQVDRYAGVRESTFLEFTLEHGSDII